MKKIIMTFFVLTLLIFKLPVLNAKVNLELNSESATILEISTNKVLYDKNMNERRAPASMTKIMTLLLVMEAIENGKISYDKKVYISENASLMGGSQVFLEAHTKSKVSELIKAVAIASANDASVALAEAVGGTLENFVAMMNKKVKELGLKNTNFKNPHGLDEANHYTTAYDMSIIASELMKHTDILRFTSIYESNFLHPNGKSIWLVNTNSLMRLYSGIDGIKTGYTTDAGFCLTATKELNKMRIITVTMNAKTKEDRNKDTIKLMEYAFANYKLKNFLKNDKPMGEIYIDKSKEKYINYYLKDDVTILLNNDNRKINYDYKIELETKKAPLEKGEKVGNLVFILNNNTYNYDLIVKDKVKKLNFIFYFWLNFKDLISGKINCK